MILTTIPADKGETIDIVKFICAEMIQLNVLCVMYNDEKKEEIRSTFDHDVRMIRMAMKAGDKQSAILRT